MTGLDRSDLFAEMVRSQCRRFVVNDRQATPGEMAEPDAGQSRVGQAAPGGAGDDRPGDSPSGRPDRTTGQRGPFSVGQGRGGPTR
jgi:hypothetical protein